MGFLIPDIWEGTFYLSTDRAVEAARVFDTAGRDAERRGELILLVHTNLGTAGVDFHAGRWDDAVRNLEGGLAVADETGAHAQLVTTHGLLARIALGRGDRSTARAHLTAGQTALEAGMHLFGVDVLMWARAAVLEADREHEAALQVLAGLWTRTETLRGLLQYHLIAPDLVRLATRLGDSGLANAVADETAVLATRSTVLSASAVAHRCAGLAAQDAEQLMAAVAEYRLTPRRVELAACCEETAGLLIAAGRIDEAIALLNEAAAIHIGSRATAELARVDATLRVHGRRRRRSGAAPSDRGWAALSPKEREVVNLVAQGLSNPHIGDRLYISRRTVETHLAHVFRKLDITNRAELAVAAVASRPDAGTVPN